MVPRPELSKNCLGQVLDISSELPATSKNLLLGESSRENLGDSKTFLGESRTFLGVTRSFLGELNKLEESEFMGRPLFVTVQGDEGFSTSAVLLPFSLMALLFHLLISACWLDTKLIWHGERCQSWTKTCKKKNPSTLKPVHLTYPAQLFSVEAVWFPPLVWSFPAQCCSWSPNLWGWSVWHEGLHPAGLNSSWRHQC